MSEFQESTFGCFDDWFSCCIAFGNEGPCVTGELVKKTTGSGFCGPMFIHCLLSCIGGAINMGKIRGKYNIDGSFIKDCLCMWCCGPCTVAQLWREVKKREGSI